MNMNRSDKRFLTWVFGMTIVVEGAIMIAQYVGVIK